MVQYITYKEKQYPIRVSYRALKTLSGQGVEKLMSGDFDMGAFEPLLWAALESGHTAEKKTLELKREDVEDILEECFTDFVGLLPLFFPKAPPQKLGNAAPDLAKDKIIVNPAPTQE